MILERVDLDDCQDLLQVALHRRRYDFVLERLPAGQKVLEIGTGPGVFTRELLPKCGSYTGVEYDPGTCLQAREKNPGAEIIEADARRLPFGERQFSFILCLEVLEHLGDWQAGLRNIHHCLRPEGLAIISVPWRRVGGKSLINQYHLYEPGEDELTALLRELFVGVEVFYLYFEETLAMTLARRFHCRRLLGLHRIYADLTAGLPHATARLRIGPSAKGFKQGLIAVLKGKKA
jgi:SAM-dependent methyltransferase